MSDVPSAPKTRRGLEAEMIAKSWRDPVYKAQLQQDPKGVLQAEVHGIDPTIALPPDLNVHVHEETPSDFHIVLPRNPADISLGEVVGGNLEAVAPQTVAVVVTNASVVTSTTMSYPPLVAQIVIDNGVLLSYVQVNVSAANIIAASNAVA